MISREEAWDLMEDLNSHSYDVCYDMWTDAGDDEDQRENVGVLQQSEFLELIEEELTDEQWEAFQHYYKTDEDFKVQYEGYAGRPMWGVE